MNFVFATEIYLFFHVAKRELKKICHLRRYACWIYPWGGSRNTSILIILFEDLIVGIL